MSALSALTAMAYDRQTSTNPVDAARTQLPAAATIDGRTLKGAPDAGMVKMVEATHEEGIATRVYPMTTPSTADAPAPRMTDAETFEVKCVFKYDAEKYRPSWVEAYNVEHNYDEYYDWENDFIVLSMPAGRYDIRANFYRLCDTSMFGDAGTAYLIVEDVDVVGNMEVELDASLITEVISFESYNPDGEKSALRYLRYLNENWDWEIITEYNVYDIYCDQMIIHKDYGMYRLHTNCGGLEVEPGPNGEWHPEWTTSIYINPLSDKYQLGQLRMMYTETEVWLVPMFAEGSHTQLVSNKGDSYTPLMNASFVKSPKGRECDVVSDWPYQMNYTIKSVGKEPGGSYGIASSSDAFYHIRYCQTSSADKHPEWDYMVRLTCVDYAENIVNQYVDEDGNIQEWEYCATTDINSPYIVLGKDANTMYPSVDNRFLATMEGGLEYDDALAEGVSSKWMSDQPLVFGASPKFLQFYYLTYQSPWYTYPIPLVGLNSGGYNGEYVSSIDAELSVMLGGEKKCGSWSELSDWQNQCAESPMAQGEMVVDYSYDNIEIDGLAGKNTARIVMDTSKEDYTAPLIQLVQLRDDDGHVTERFTDPSTATLLIAAADFQHRNGEGTMPSGEQAMWYDIEPCDLTVEYSPYGSNDYHTIAMDCGNEAIRRFGQIYTGTLGNIAHRSASGWYDLRIVASDVEGNSHEQIISPAFYVATTSGLQTVGSNNNENLRLLGGSVVADGDAIVEVYDMAGRRVINHNLTTGVYVARSGASVAKIMVK